MHRIRTLAFTALMTLPLLVGSLAWADFSDTIVIHESDGFPGVCNAPCFSVELHLDFYDAGSPNDPGYCAATEDTYVYTLLHLGGTLPPPNIPVTEFELLIENAPTTVSTAFWDDTVPFPGDVDPLSATVTPLTVVHYGFPGELSCPNCLEQGQISAPLYLCADADTTDPDADPDNVSVGAGTLLATSDVVVPVLSGPRMVDIDVSPFSTTNKIPAKPYFPIVVALLGSTEVDVSLVDTASLAFGPDEAAPIWTGVFDINGDGEPDLLSKHFYGETGLPMGDGPACITGLLDGAPFEGCDTVKVFLPKRCGLGSELVLLLPPLLWLRVRRRQTM